MGETILPFPPGLQEMNLGCFYYIFTLSIHYPIFYLLHFHSTHIASVLMTTWKVAPHDVLMLREAAGRACRGVFSESLVARKTHHLLVGSHYRTHTLSSA